MNTFGLLRHGVNNLELFLAGQCSKFWIHPRAQIRKEFSGLPAFRAGLVTVGKVSQYSRSCVKNFLPFRALASLPCVPLWWPCRPVGPQVSNQRCAPLLPVVHGCAGSSFACLLFLLLLRVLLFLLSCFAFCCASSCFSFPRPRATAYNTRVIGFQLLPQQFPTLVRTDTAAQSFQLPFLVSNSQFPNPTSP